MVAAGPPPRSPLLSPAARGRLCVVTAAVLWSLSGVVTKSDLLSRLEPTAIAFYRSLFAGLALVPLVRPSRWVFRPSMVPLGLVFGTMIGLYIAAIRATTAANAIFLQCSATLWMVPLGALFLGERPDARSRLAIGLAAPGILSILVFGHGGSPTEWRGVAMGLASGLCYAVVVIGMRGMRAIDSMWLSGINNLGGAITLALAMLIVTGSLPSLNAAQLVVLVLFGAVQMAIPYALFARGLREIGAAEAGLISLVEPILNPILVWLVLRERVAPATIVGGLFLLLGVAVRYLPWRRSRAEGRTSGPLAGDVALEPPGSG
jgi:drug/metabolite transporter (DMT)-like permease